MSICYCDMLCFLSTSEIEGQRQTLISRWFMCSSSSRMCGFISKSTMDTTCDFCPPDSLLINCKPSHTRAHWATPNQMMQNPHIYPVISLTWKFPRWFLHPCSIFPGNLEVKNWTGDMTWLSVSMWWSVVLSKVPSVTNIHFESRRRHGNLHL